MRCHWHCQLSCVHACRGLPVEAQFLFSGPNSNRRIGTCNWQDGHSCLANLGPVFGKPWTRFWQIPLIPDDLRRITNPQILRTRVWQAGPAIICRLTCGWPGDFRLVLGPINWNCAPVGLSLLSIVYSMKMSLEVVVKRDSKDYPIAVGIIKSCNWLRDPKGCKDKSLHRCERMHCKSAIVRTRSLLLFIQLSWSLLPSGPYFRVVITIGWRWQQFNFVISFRVCDVVSRVKFYCNKLDVSLFQQGETFFGTELVGNETSSLLQ